MNLFESTRRTLLRNGLIGGSSLLLSQVLRPLVAAQTGAQADPPAMDHGRMGAGGGRMDHGDMTTVGEVDHERNGFDPHAMLTDWDTGRVSSLPSGQTLREFTLTAVDKEI